MLFAPYLVKSEKIIKYPKKYRHYSKKRVIIKQ